MGTAGTGVLVLGMHRSGTSATTRAINLLGVPLAASDELQPASKNNPTGFWEVSRLGRLNDRLLRMLGGSVLAPPVLDDGWAHRPGLERRRRRARRLFLRAHTTDHWVWKDPRNCVLLPFWLHALDAGPVLVLVHREPFAVARSLQVRSPRQRIPPELALASWERHVREMLRNARGLPAFVLGYADLLADPCERGAELRTFLEGHGVPCPAEDGESRVAEHVAPGAGSGTGAPAQQAKDATATPPRPEGREAGSEVEMSAAQQELLAALESLAGSHDRFEPPELPGETASTEALLAERRRADLERPVRKGRRRGGRRDEAGRRAAGQVEGGRGSAPRARRARRRHDAHGPDAERTLWIVSGPSSVGKSRFLASRRASEVTGLPPNTPVLFPSSLGRDATVPESSFLHYNILRPSDERIMAGARRAAGPGRPLTFRDDRRWRRAARLPIAKRAILLVADRETLEERIRRRIVTEEGYPGTYKADVWLTLYRGLDLTAVYDAWRRELHSRGIPVLELDATRDDYPELQVTS